MIGKWGGGTRKSGEDASKPDHHNLKNKAGNVVANQNQQKKILTKLPSVTNLEQMLIGQGEPSQEIATNDVRSNRKIVYTRLVEPVPVINIQKYCYFVFLRLTQ